MRATLLALLFLALPASGNMPSATSAVFTSDPADCSATDPDVCPTGDSATALDEFPYWDYAATNINGGGTHWFLGTSQGYLWSISCNHCGAGATTGEIAYGTYAGQEFDSFNPAETTGAYKQFNKTGNVPVSSSVNTGDILYRWKTQGSDTLPVMHLMPALQRMTDLDDGTIMLSIGQGTGGVHTTRGWFAECGRDGVQSGGPADIGDIDACCLAPRAGGENVYQPPSSGTMAHSAPMYTTSRTGYGGEGVYDDCMAAELTYLGPVYGGLGETRQWFTWEYRKTYFSSDTDADDEVPARWLLWPDYFGDSDGADAPHALGVCSTVESVDGAREWAVWAAPTSPVPTNAYCSWDAYAGSDAESPTGVGNVNTGIGDSGGSTWAYVPSRTAGDRWVFVGSGTSVMTPQLSTLQFRSDYEEWVLGITSGHRSCYH